MLEVNSDILGMLKVNTGNNTKCNLLQVNQFGNYKKVFDYALFVRLFLSLRNTSVVKQLCNIKFSIKDFVLMCLSS